LIVTNAASLGVVAVLLRRGRPSAPGLDAADAGIRPALSSTPTPVGSSARSGPTRRMIGIEILNPIELARVRGRMFGIAGSLVPHLTRRIVYDQTAQQLREQLAAHGVDADVRVHVVPASAPPARTVTPAPTEMTSTGAAGAAGAVATDVPIEPSWEQPG
jgi:hypothetical protein